MILGLKVCMLRLKHIHCMLVRGIARGALISIGALNLDVGNFHFTPRFHPTGIKRHLGVP